MRQLFVWFAALGGIAVLIMAWSVVTPIGGRFADYFNATSNFTGNQDAIDAYDTTSNIRTYGLRSFLYICVGVFGIYALASMQRREEYSGVYR